MKWIDKNKQKPPIGEFEHVSIFVLVTDENMIGYGCYNYYFEKWTYCMPNYIERDDNAITHWMLFPELPS